MSTSCYNPFSDIHTRNIVSAITTRKILKSINPSTDEESLLIRPKVIFT